jgi:putative NADPH-quinone reductase
MAERSATNVLVVLAHPCDDSFARHLADRAAAGAAAAGNRVDVVDLYADGFTTAMSADERRAYHGDRPVLDPLVEQYARLVLAAHTIVFVYPTWWSGLPAILKGWLERVLVPGVAFGFDERTGKVRPRMGHVRLIVGVSTYGSSRRYVAAVNDNGRRTLARALRITCGPRTRVRWYGLYSMDTASDLDRAEFAARVERAMAAT